MPWLIACPLRQTEADFGFSKRKWRRSTPSTSRWHKDQTRPPLVRQQLGLALGRLALLALRSNRAPCRSHSSQRETAQLTWGRPSSRQLPLICLNLKQPRSFLDQLVSRSVSYPTKSFNTTLHPQKLSTDFCRFEFNRAIKFQCEAFGEVSGNQQQQDPRRHFHR